MKCESISRNFPGDAKQEDEVSDTHVTPIPKTGPAVMNLCAKYGIDPTKLNPTGEYIFCKELLFFTREPWLRAGLTIGIFIFLKKFSTLSSIYKDRFTYKQRFCD